ncbi:MAG: tRNA 2-selenouridine(34) synthase MnmH [Deltaproteobacteria bacterium]|nr:tRNA 2-selenouridine(34) synthase MnmH [Deltaproteobacteria bacterium]
MYRRLKYPEKPGRKSPLQTFLQGQLPSVCVTEALQPFNTLIDVRTSEEYHQGAIPRSLNHPLFDKLERSLIGSLYRQVGKDAAIQRGTSLIAPQLEHFLGSLRPLQSKLLTIYCARGGMRSKSLTRFLKSEGFRVQQLEGGYKAYRRHVLEFLKGYRPSLIVLHGRTGVGKTLLIRSLPDSLDLEDLAQHRSSIFGAVHLQPRTQKNFEALFHSQISDKPKKQLIFVEGESRKVGRVFIPEAFAEAMKKGKKVLLKASMETRVRRILDEYHPRDEKTLLQIEEILPTLRESLGKSMVEHLRNCLVQEKFEEFIQILLEKYYDPRYEHGMKDYQYDLDLSAEDLEQTQHDLIRFHSLQS